MRKSLNNSINVIEYMLYFVIRVFWESKSRVLQSFPAIQSCLPATSHIAELEVLKRTLVLVRKRFQNFQRKVITHERGQACNAFKEAFGGRD